MEQQLSKQEQWGRGSVSGVSSKGQSELRAGPLPESGLTKMMCGPTVCRAQRALIGWVCVHADEMWGGTNQVRDVKTGQEALKT